MGWKRSIVEVLLGLFYQHLWSQVKHCLQLIGKAVVSKINESHQIKQLFRICWLVVRDKGIGVWQYLMHFKPPKCQLTDHSCDKIIINSVPEVNLLPPLFVFVDEIFLVMVECFAHLESVAVFVLYQTAGDDLAPWRKDKSVLEARAPAVHTWYLSFFDTTTILS